MKFCDVAPFLPEYKPLPNVPIVNAASAYNHLDSGELFILMFNQSFYKGDQVDILLLYPNQMHAHGIIVDGCPVHFSPNHSSNHSLFVEEHNFQIPLHLDGIVSYLDTFSHLMTTCNAALGSK